MNNQERAKLIVRKEERKPGRPTGTTKANGYGVSPGRPVTVVKDWETFEKKLLQGFNRLKGNSS